MNKLIAQYKHVYISWKACSILTRTMRRHDQELFLCLKKILNRINSYSVRSLCSTAFLSWKVSSCGVIYCVGDFYVNQVSSFLVILVSYSHLLELDWHRFFTHALIQVNYSHTMQIANADRGGLCKYNWLDYWIFKVMRKLGRSTIDNTWKGSGEWNISAYCITKKGALVRRER